MAQWQNGGHAVVSSFSRTASIQCSLQRTVCLAMEDDMKLSEYRAGTDQDLSL
jgi:hypothetical protein